MPTNFQRTFGGRSIGCIDLQIVNNASMNHSRLMGGHAQYAVTSRRLPRGGNWRIAHHAHP
jgi:hypothetical protein